MIATVHYIYDGKEFTSIEMLERVYDLNPEEITLKWIHECPVWEHMEEVNLDRISTEQITINGGVRK